MNKKAKEFGAQWKGMTDMERCRYIANNPVSINDSVMDFTEGRIGFMAVVRAPVPLYITGICSKQSEALQKAADFVRHQEEKIAAVESSDAPRVGLDPKPAPVTA